MNRTYNNLTKSISRNSNGMKQRGFTIIELIVVIVIIGILASLGTAQLLRTEPVARDKARADDVSTIKLALEDIYKNGQIDDVTIPSGDPSVTDNVAMGYPSTQLISSSGDTQAVAIFSVIDQRALKSPRTASSAGLPNFSFVAATNSSSSTAPSASNDIYVYQPLDEAGNLCKFATGDSTTGSGNSATTGYAASANQKTIAPRLKDNCVKFNIYYYSEAKKTIQTVTSTASSNNGL